ncbi:MAG: radical SAM protein, partial [Actinobacteria bacterium]|nr:radical SAM protein [Actinomycetota bacterium]
MPGRGTTGVPPVKPSARLSDDEALALLAGGDLLELGARADEVRRALHPGDEVTFIVDRNINYTNVCVSGCRFCAFYRAPGDPQAYVLTEAEIHAKVAETLALGGTAVMMQGGLNPDLDITWYERLLRGIKERFTIHIHSLSPPEVAHIAAVSGLSVEEALRRLRAAGLDSLPGGGAEVIVDRVRRAVSPHKIGAAGWLDVMRTAHRLGLPGTATMMFGARDTATERIAHLRAVRELQDETGGFTA